MEAVCTFLQFVPMEDEVLEFFKPVASDILKKLKAKPCIPTQADEQGKLSHTKYDTCTLYKYFFMPMKVFLYLSHNSVLQKWISI